MNDECAMMNKKRAAGCLTHHSSLITHHSIVPAHTDHIFWLASNMSKADRDECQAGGLGPFRALSDSLERSVAAWTGMVETPVMSDECGVMNGKRAADSSSFITHHSSLRPVCMFGVTPLDILGGIGSPWLLGTEEVKRYGLTFLRFNKKYIPVMLELFPRLVNYVDVRNEISVRWLKWLGFRFDAAPVPYGPFGMPFYRFEKHQ